QLYVTGMYGWGNYATRDGSFERVRYIGGPAYLPTLIETHGNGVLLTFSDPLDPSVAGDARRHFAQCWNYRYSPAYGSPEFSVVHPGVRGTAPLSITSAHLLDGGKRLFLEIPKIVPANTIHLYVEAIKGEYREIFLTAHRLGGDFIKIPNYHP